MNTVVNVMHEHKEQKKCITDIFIVKIRFVSTSASTHILHHACSQCAAFFCFTVIFLLVPFTAENHIHVFVSTNLMLSSCSQLLFNACPKTCLGFLCAIFLFKLDVFLEEKLGVLQRESTLKELPAKRRDKRS